MVNFLWPRRLRPPKSLWLLAGADGTCPEGGVPAANPGFEHGGGVAMRRRLNAFFAIWVNSPSLSMVNFSCCVCSALIACAPGVTRRVAPQPTRAAVRMEAGAHACI